MYSFQTVGEMFMVDSVDLIPFTAISEIAIMLAKVGSFFDDFLEVEIHVRWKRTNLIYPVAQSCPQGNQLLDR